MQLLQTLIFQNFKMSSQSSSSGITKTSEALSPPTTRESLTVTSRCTPQLPCFNGMMNCKPFSTTQIDLISTLFSRSNLCTCWSAPFRRETSPTSAMTVSVLTCIFKTVTIQSASTDTLISSPGTEWPSFCSLLAFSTLLNRSFSTPWPSLAWDSTWCSCQTLCSATMENGTSGVGMFARKSSAEMKVTV